MNKGLGSWFALDLGGTFGISWFLLGGIGGSCCGFGGGIDFETLIDSRFMVWIGLNLGGIFGFDGNFGFDGTFGFNGIFGFDGNFGFDGIFGFDGTLGLCDGLDSLNFSLFEAKSMSKITGKNTLCTKTL